MMTTALEAIDIKQIEGRFTEYFVGMILDEPGREFKSCHISDDGPFQYKIVMCFNDGTLVDDFSIPLNWEPLPAGVLHWLENYLEEAWHSLSEAIKRDCPQALATIH